MANGTQLVRFNVTLRNRFQESIYYLALSMQCYRWIEHSLLLWSQLRVDQQVHFGFPSKLCQHLLGICQAVGFQDHVCYFDAFIWMLAIPLPHNFRLPRVHNNQSGDPRISRKSEAVGIAASGCFQTNPMDRFWQSLHSTSVEAKAGQQARHFGKASVVKIWTDCFPVLIL